MIAEKTYATATACDTCHVDMRVEGSLIQAQEGATWFRAPGYMEAMHGLCVTCHKKEEAEASERHAGLAGCRACHQGSSEVEMEELTPRRPSARKVAHANDNPEVYSQAKAER